MLAPLAGQVRLSCGYVGTVGSILGPTSGHLGAHDDAMWAQFGGYNSGVAKNHLKLYLQNALPHGPWGVTEEIPKTIEQNLLQNANPHGRQPKIIRSKNTSPKS